MERSRVNREPVSAPVEKPSGRRRIVPLVADLGDRRVLTDWLNRQPDVDIVDNGPETLISDPLDLCIVDVRGFRTHREHLRSLKNERDALIPVLLVVSQGDLVGRSPESVEDVQLVDEYIVTPIRKRELAGRVEALLRLREQSVALARRNRLLLVVNHLTRHDIRNEMNIIQGWSTILNDSLNGDQQDALRRIHQSTHHVVEITDSLREFIEVYQNQDDLTPIQVPLEPTLMKEIETRRRAYANASLSVVTDVPSVRVMGNRLLSAVFRNILTNAIRHNNAEEPIVEISIEQEPQSVTVRIADNGPGIKDELREAILGRSDRGVDHPEAGMGLSLVDSLVDMFGGEVWIEPNEPRGTVFAVRLPIETEMGD